MKQIDTLLSRGDHAVDSRGIPVALTGQRELIQRALLRLTLKKGSFANDPSLGSELYKLCEIHGGDLSRMAQSYAQEALISMPEVTVSGVELKQQNNMLRLYVNLSVSENKYQLEVDIQ